MNTTEHEFDAELLNAFKAGFKNTVYDTIESWAASNLSLPASAFAMPGAFSIDKSKYMRDVFAALKNPKIRTVSICKAVQSGGSLVGQVFLPYVILNKKGVFLYLCQNDEMASITAETRIHPILRSIPEFKDMLPRGTKNALRAKNIKMDTCNVLISSAKEKFVQSNSCLVVIGDECWQWKQGIMDMARTRTSKFPNTYKILWISQPNETDTDWYNEFHKGIIHTWSWTCPKCGLVQPYDFDKQRKDGSWAGIIWQNKMVGDKKDIFATAATAKFQCFEDKCRHEIADTPVNRKMLMDSSKYVVSNTQNGDPSHCSFVWNSMATIDIPIAYNPSNPGPSLVVEYLQAKEAQKEGNLLPYKNFWTQKLSKFWSESDSERQYQVMMQKYDPLVSWPECKYIIMSVDVQPSCFWIIIRAWNDKAESRLLHFGKVSTWSEVRDLQLKHNVIDQHVFVDSGFNTSEVYANCVQNGHITKLPNGTSIWACWSAVKGSASPNFTHSDPNSKVLDRRIYAKRQYADPMIGKSKDGKANNYKVPLFVYSSNSVKDILRTYRDGKGPQFLTFTDDKVYTEQMNAEIKRKVKDKKTGKDIWSWCQIKKDNHAFDCEAIQILAQVLLGNIKM